MATDAGSIFVKVSADTSQFSRGMKETSRRMDTFGKSSRSMAASITRLRTIASAVLGGTLVMAAKKAVTAYSDLNEQINKATVVFTASGREVVAWSQTLTKSFGLSSRAALEAAGTFGNMLVPMGFARAEAAKMSMRMVELAGDMASFNNASPEDTLLALRAGLAGEVEPLRKFGVFLNEARVKQEALNLGLYAGKGQLDAAAKAAATYAIILKDTKDTQGDFARTADGLANTTRTLRAQFENLAAKLGEGLYPAVQKIAGAFSAWLDRPETTERLQNLGVLIGEKLTQASRALVAFWEKHGQTIANILAGAWSASQKLKDAFLSMLGVLDRIVGAFGGWKTAIEAIAIGAVILKLRALTAGFTLLAGAEAAAGRAAGTAGAGLGILGASSAARKLHYNLTQLVKLGGIVVTVDVVLRLMQDPSLDKWARGWEESWLGRLGIPSPFGKPKGASLPTPAGFPEQPALSAITGGTAQGRAIASAAGAEIGSGRVYNWGGASAQTGYDCSGVIYDMYRRQGIKIPRDTRGQWNDPIAVRVPKGQESPGDALYFVGSLTGRNAGPPPGHAGIYIGGGLYVEYYSQGKPARINQIGARGDYMGARRWLKITPSPSGGEAVLPSGAGATAAAADTAKGAAKATAESAADAQIRAVKETLAAEARATGLPAKRFAVGPGFAGGPLIPQLLTGLADWAGFTGGPGFVGGQKIKDAMDAFKQAAVEKIRKVVDALKSAVTDKRGAVAEAFGTVMDKALRVFDAKTAELVRRARAKVAAFGFEIGVGEETPAERALAEFDRQREAEEMAETRAAALAIEDPVERARRFRELDLADTRRNLQAQAALERAAADEALATERARIEDERSLLRDRFSGRFQMIVQAFQAEKITAAEAQAQISALFGEFGAGLTDAAILGQWFAVGFKDAMDATTAAVRELAAAIDELNRALSKLPGGGPALPGGTTPGMTNPRMPLGPVRISNNEMIIPGIGRFPYMQGGGVVGSTGLVFAHRGETILPAGAGMAGTTVIVNVAGSLIHERDLEDVIHAALVSKSKRSGVLFSRTAGAAA